MDPWLFLLAPVTAFAVVSSFGVIGCAAIAGLDEAFTAETYDARIKGESSLVAYWRLGEPSATPVPSSGGTAKSEKGPHNGDYEPLAKAPVDNARHSPPVGGPKPLVPIQLGQSPGLLTKSPNETGMQSIDGAGYVQVPFANALNPSKFTLEAWVRIDIGNEDNAFPGNYYCVVESTGPPGKNGLGAKKAGFGLYIGPRDVPPKTPPGEYVWQLWMGDGAKLSQVAVSKDAVTFKKTTYLALTFDGTTAQLFLFIPGTGQDLDHIAGQFSAPPANFKFKPVDSTILGDFFIGSGSNLYPGVPGTPSQRLYPFKGYIQEVALYNVDLSAPNNQGLVTLAGHEQSGGDF